MPRNRLIISGTADRIASGPTASGVSKGDSAKHGAVEKRGYIRDNRPDGLSITVGCRLIDIARSTYYDAPAARAGEVELLTAICDEFEAYGWRRVRAALRHQGIVL
ncbi:hypothetical protein F9288_12980 [Sphingomonas sp. CL5.1]|uniref:hypothetical protein n=1 Tax=Sphingomonas sp. CL5.1 TaxID=2653203 RepID=UPI001583A7A3|nr:hypothetical protein [Sphingomonas sp. CL5.1]QKR98215.1 hypothetical protein F9288_12980 [Sphingomonas sp. CL5.1]